MRSPLPPPDPGYQPPAFLGPLRRAVAPLGTHLRCPEARPATDRAAVCALTLLALGLRLWRASTASLRGDEAFSVLFASQGLLDLLGQLRAAEPHPPLYYAGLHFWMRLAGEGELAVRLPSILFGTLMVPLAYSLARAAAPPAPALLPALLITVNPFLVWHSQDARMYTLLPVFATASFLFATRLLLGRPRTGEGQAARARRSIRDYAGLVVANALMMYTHYAGAYVLLAENVAGMCLAARALTRTTPGREPSRQPSPRVRVNNTPTRALPGCGAEAAGRSGCGEATGETPAHPGVGGSSGAAGSPACGWTRWGTLSSVRPGTAGPAIGWLLSQVAILTLCLPWWLYAREVLLGRTIAWLESLSLPALLFEAWMAYSLGPVASPDVARLLGLAFLPPLALGLATWSRRQAGQTLALYLAVPLLGAYLMSLRRPVFLDRYFVFVVPVYALAVATGLAALRSRSRPLFAANLLAVLAVSAHVLAGYYLDPRLAKSPDWRGAGSFVVAHYRPGDLLILNSPDPTLAYYVRRPGVGPQVPCRTLPETGPPNRVATEDALRKLAGAHSRIWLVPIRDPSWDADGLVDAWLDAYAHPLAEERFGGLRLRLFATPAALLSAQPRPPPLNFGGQIEYLGHDLSRDGSPGTPAPTTFRPGDELWLTLYFRAVRPIDGDYRVFNHLMDETDRRRGQHDGPPVFGRHPTPAWRVGELVMDRHRIPIGLDSPPGRYRILTGYYDPVSGRRLPIADEAGRPLGDAVTIEGIAIQAR